MEKKSYDNVPTFVEAAESGASKTATTSKMVKDSYSIGMNFLTGDGMTTSCETEVIIDPDEEWASIGIKLIAQDEIFAKLLRNIQVALVPEVRNVVASLPANDNKILDQFVENAVETRAELQDEKFRVHRLLINKYDEYHKYLSTIFKVVFEKASEATFRSNCSEAGRKSKSEATVLIEQLVSSMLDEKVCKEAIEGLQKLIGSEITEILEKSAFKERQGEPGCFECENLKPEEFSDAVKIISNSKKKELEGVPSIACALKSVRFVVPGDGISIGLDKPSAYRLIDIVGFTNDGLANVNELISNAILSQYNYDGIIYFASNKTINKTHESILSEIFKSMRPAKLIIVSPFMDKDALFDEDEVPTIEMIQDLNRRRIEELLDIVRKVATDDLHVILPSREDIICISNKIREKKHGAAACNIYGSEQYLLIRNALERAANIIRKKIFAGVDRTAQYMLPAKPVEEIVGQLVNQLGTTIDTEYSKLRDSSSQIHHWTLDAILWNMLAGREHISDAKVWKNVQITTFTEMQKICLNNFGNFKFSSDVKVGNPQDSVRIKNEFMANLQTELYWVVRDIILKESTDEKMDSDYKKTIRRLALTSKYNKWKIIDDLRLCLMKAVVQTEFLEKKLNNSINEALLKTYDKLLY